MRILITTGIFPPDIGGPATYVPVMASGLVERGHQVTVITLSDRTDHDDSAYPYPVVRIPREMWKPWRMVQTTRAILHHGKEADVLFVNGLALESVLANKLMRKPLVMKVVGDLAWERAHGAGWAEDDLETFQRKRYGWKIEVLKMLRTWWTRQADRVIVPSQYLARWVREWGVPEDRVRVIYNAVEPVNGVKPLPVPLSTPVKAVTVCRLVPWKRVDHLLEAVAQVPDLGLVVVGDGPERSRLEHLAESLGISDRVYFAGQHDRKETLGFMAACDVFVLNSTYEGLPHVVLEAMALGLPVIATAVGGTPEAVQHGETGILIPPDEPDRLPQVLRRWVEEGKKEREQQTAFMERFTLRGMLDRTEAVFNDIGQKCDEREKIEREKTGDSVKAKILEEIIAWVRRYLSN